MKKFFAKIFASRPPNGNIDLAHLQSILINPIGPGLGDAIVLTNAISQLRASYPNIKIGVITHPRNEVIFKNNPLQVELVRQSLFYALTHRHKWQVFLDGSSRFTTQGILFSFLLNFSYVICFEKEDKKYYNAASVRNYNEYVIGLDHIHLSKLLSLTSLKKHMKDVPSTYILPPAEQELQAVGKFVQKDKLNIMVCPLELRANLIRRNLRPS